MLSSADGTAWCDAMDVGNARGMEFFNWVERDYKSDAVVNNDVVDDDFVEDDVADDDVVDDGKNEVATMLSSVDGTAWCDAMDVGNGRGMELL